MTAIEFFKLLVFSNLNTKDISLHNLCETFEIENNISISKQSLDDKFDSESIAFVKQMLEKLLAQKIIEESQKMGDILANFTSVRVKDATSFKLPPNMAELYSASTQNTEESILKIQYEFDLKKGQIYDISFHSYTDADTKNAVTNLNDINQDDLIVRDLGYVSLQAMQGIAEKKAYFLNRFDMTSNAYETIDSKEKINFGKIQEYLKKNNIRCTEKNVFIGDKIRMPVRMIIELLPDSEIEKRMRKLKRLESKRGRTYSDQYRASSQLNIYVTNTLSEQLPKEDVRQIYRLRWQIELVFKTWKSVGKIAETKKMKPDRLQTMLYAKMILLVLCHFFFWNATVHLQKHENKTLSFYKTVRTILNHLKEIKQALKRGRESICEIVEIVTKFICRNCKLEKKKNTLSSTEIIQLKKDKTTKK